MLDRWFLASFYKATALSQEWKSKHFLGAGEHNGVARRSQSLRLGRSEFVMINEGNSRSEGRGMNKDTKVVIDIPGVGDETKLLMESQVSQVQQWIRGSLLSMRSMESI